jgi:hypothetical protein
VKFLVFEFWFHQETGFEASERNKDASHAPTVRKLTIDFLHKNVWLLSWRALPQIGFLKQKRERSRGEREKRKRRKGRERRKGEEAPANSPLEWPE